MSKKRQPLKTSIDVALERASSGTNFGRLYDAAQPKAAGSGQRYRWPVAEDYRRSISDFDWKTLVSTGRHLFVNFGPVRGAILEKALLSVGDSWIPQFKGDPALADEYESWVWEWMKIADVRGDAYDFRTQLYLDSIAVDRDGDVGTLLISTDQGYPLLQSIPATRIGSRGHPTVIETGSYAGLTIINGCIQDKLGRVVAYRVLADKPEDDADVSARDMILSFQPEFHDQCRGISSIAHAALDFEDVQDIFHYEKQGIKASATTSLLHYNETGVADVGKSFIDGSSPPSGDDVEIEKMEGGSILYFRAGSGQKLEAFNGANRPAESVTKFTETIIRGAYQGMSWPYELARDSSGLSSPGVHLVVSKAQRAVEQRQCLLRKKAIRAIGYAVSKAVKLGLLPQSDSWWKWDFQLPAKLSSHVTREAQQNREDILLGTRSLAEDAGERGVDWQELRDQVEAETEDLLQRAQRLSTEYKIDMPTAINLLQRRTPNPQLTAAPQP